MGLPWKEGYIRLGVDKVCFGQAELHNYLSNNGSIDLLDLLSTSYLVVTIFRDYLSVYPDFQLYPWHSHGM